VSELEMSPKTRREVLGLIGGVGAALFVAACGSSGGASSATKTTSAKASATTTTTTPTTTTAATAAVSSWPNVLSQSGVVRRDIRSSFGSASGVATGVPLTVDLTVVDTKNGCKVLADAAVYIWHCNQDGLYSMYGQGITDENYLRGVQATDANGGVTFTSIFPAAYSGRWPHIHFEVFSSVATATNGANKMAVSQLALPADACNAVYATTGYSQSASNLARSSLQTDNVFSDGTALQTPTITGDMTNGYTAKLLIGV
jgi:protocatechuate 3,4-dioxygenase beta subunit